MRKYWAVFKISWKNAVEYRAEFLGHMILGLITLLVMYFIWSAIFKNRQYFGNYTFSSMMTYMILVRFLHFVKRSNVGRQIAEEIKEGRLSVYLTKPVSYLRWWFASFLADRFFEAILRILMLFIFLVLFPKVFSFPGISRFLAVLIFLTVSLLVNFLFNLFVATCAFFVTDIKLFHNSLFLIVDFLAGGQIPIDLMPGFLKTVGNFLPFQFMVFFPVKIYQGDFNLSQVFQGILVCFVWIIFLTYILRIFWLKGVKKYEAVGQ
jgi:ABC-2 type transport system permease protein